MTGTILFVHVGRTPDRFVLREVDVAGGRVQCEEPAGSSDVDGCGCCCL